MEHEARSARPASSYPSLGFGCGSDRRALRHPDRRRRPPKPLPPRCAAGITYFDTGALLRHRPGRAPPRRRPARPAPRAGDLYQGRAAPQPRRPGGPEPTMFPTPCPSTCATTTATTASCARSRTACSASAPTAWTSSTSTTSTGAGTATRSRTVSANAMNGGYPALAELRAERRRSRRSASA